MFVFNFFFLLSLCVIISCSFVIFSVNPVYSLLWLVLSFLFSSVLLVLTGCEFLALIFIVIYIGAIAVLFLFVLMLLDLKIKNLRSKKSKFFFPTIFAGISFSFFLLVLNSNFFKYNFLFYNLNFIYFDWFFKLKNSITFSQFSNFNNIVFVNWKDFTFSLNEVDVYGTVFYDIFVLQFLLVGFILLAVLVGIVFLTNIYNSSKMIDQSNFKQISIKSDFFKQI